MDYTKKGGLLTDLILKVFQTNGELIEWGNRLALPFAQTSARWQVLGALKSEALTVPAIAQKMGQSRQNIQCIVNVFLTEKLCEIVPNPRNLRSPLIRLTSTGKNALKQMNLRQMQWANKVGETFALNDLERALDALTQLKDYLALENDVNPDCFNSFTCSIK